MKANPSDALTTVAKAGVATTLGLATLVTTFVLSCAALYQVSRLDYDSTRYSLIGGITAAILLFSLVVWYSPLQSTITGQNRTAFIAVATWLSLLLPLETFIECGIGYKWHHAIAFRWGLWWFTMPMQFVVGGLLGIVVAIANRNGVWAAWGVTCSAWGTFWMSTVLFRAR